jgi:hypothetical protein
MYYGIWNMAAILTSLQSIIIKIRPAERMPTGSQYPVNGSFPQWEARPFSGEPAGQATMGLYFL